MWELEDRGNSDKERRVFDWNRFSLVHLEVDTSDIKGDSLSQYRPKKRKTNGNFYVLTAREPKKQLGLDATSLDEGFSHVGAEA